MLARPLSLCAALIALALPAQAGPNMDELVQIDILDGGPTKRGTYMAAVRLTLSDGWKTYWRAPGETGIPPSFNWRGSRNLDGIAITWPAPEVFTSGGAQTIGYTEQMVLPIEVHPSKDGKDVRLKGTIDFGLCSDVCVPASLDFDHTVDTGAKRNPVIAAALAQRPYSPAEAGVTATTCHVRPSDYGMLVETHIKMPSAGGQEVVVIEAGAPGLWATEAEVTRRGNTLIATSEVIRDDGEPFALDRSQLRFTVLGQHHSVDIRGCTAG